MLSPENVLRQQNELLLLQRQGLEENLRLLSEEVESLSLTNSRLLNELKTKNFYIQYNAVVQEVFQSI